MAKGKAPAFQFYVRDWLSSPDIQMSTPTTRGIWINFLAYMWESKYRGEVEGTRDELCKLGGCSEGELEMFFKDARRHNFCDIVTDHNNNITVINRRMLREHNTRENSRKRQQKYRDKLRDENSLQKSNANNNGKSNAKVTHPSSSSSSSSKDKLPNGSSSTDQKSVDCPHKEIIALYHDILPELRKVKTWTKSREDWLRTRWREDEDRQNLTWWSEYFAMIRTSDFLMGRTARPFSCDLEWLVRPNNMAKVLEGKYNNDKGVVEDDDGYGDARKRIVAARRRRLEEEKVPGTDLSQ